MTLEPKCPLDGTAHSDSCPLKPVLKRMDAVVTCPFQPDCAGMLEDENRAILARLYEAARLVSYYESAEGEYANEIEQRMKAKDALLDLMELCKARGIEFDLKGFMI